MWGVVLEELDGVLALTAGDKNPEGEDSKRDTEGCILYILYNKK